MFDLKDIRRILIIRMGPLGETLQTTPVLKALRAAIPQAYMAMMVTSDRVDLVSANPNLNEVIVYDKSMPRLIYKLRRRKFDTAIILQPTFRLVLICLLAGIKNRIGFEPRSGSKRFLKVAVGDNRTQHETDRYLDVIRATGIKPLDNEIEMFVTDEAQKWVDEFLMVGAQHTAPLRLIGINPGGFWPDRRWPVDRFVKVADTLVYEFGVKILITLGPSEVELEEQLLKLMRAKPIILKNTTPMKIAAAFTRCEILISNDTGPMHIGVAVKTPTLGLFGNSDPKRWGPIAKIHRIVHRPGGMDKIIVEDVLSVAREMLIRRIKD